MVQGYSLPLRCALSVLLTPELPESLGFLFEPSRYKCAYGGRGGAKSWGVARALLILGAQKPLRILCAREFQKSISDSVHKLLSDQIRSLGMEKFYTIQQTVIRGLNGTEFTFHGLKHNISNIKSVEGTDIAWVEEAQTVSKSSWDVLIPTIRKEGSEIWVTFNPELEEDETYKRFVVNPPSTAVVKKINWSDNPWFPKVLFDEKEDLKERDLDAYLNVWEGFCKTMLEGAVYAREMSKVREEGRIIPVPYDASLAVHTVWDLGWADHTAIWFVQSSGNELRIIDYWQDHQVKISDWLVRLQGKGYVYGTDWLPHDARAKSFQTGMSTQELMVKAGRNVQIVPNLSINDGINAVRTILNRCYFDEKRCADGISCLYRYRYDVDPDSGRFSNKPLHDEYSHGADAFRYLAVMASLMGPLSVPKMKFDTQFTRDIFSDRADVFKG